MENRYQFKGIINQSVKFVEENQILREELWRRFVTQFKEDDAEPSIVYERSKDGGEQ
jgi:hypothetical protein